jgi:AraC family transcriptional regulator, regulatory protein of adaptative response / DNA-3-methyladenine glycosylase II
VDEDFDARYKVLGSRDHRFDGQFFVAVSSTGVYCRPSCPAAIPKRRNVRFYPTAAAAQEAGFRACLRCRPDASPGSPEWNLRADLASRAMALIADGVVDREGIPGLARRLAYSERHIHRQLLAEFGAGPLALARAQRAQTARMLIETSHLPFVEVSYAAGFSSVRQFNETMRRVYGRTPTELRKRAPAERERLTAPNTLTVRLAYRDPLDWAGLLSFLSARAIPGVEEVLDGTYRRTLPLPHGWGVAELRHADRYIACRLHLSDLRDLGSAVQRCRRLLDLDADPTAIDGQLVNDPSLGALVRTAPGRRVPGTVDGAELALRAVFGQQVSVAAARTMIGKITLALGEPLPAPDGGLTHLFPSPKAVDEAGPAVLSGPQRRRETLWALARALACGELVLHPSSDRVEVRARLIAIHGIGSWTAGYIAMRALCDPDVFLPADLGVRRALERFGKSLDSTSLTALSTCWRPWRAYAVQHLWASLHSDRPKEPASMPSSERQQKRVNDA